jgi:RimJ/RimL family protein N-acetyltransferase
MRLRLGADAAVAAWVAARIPHMHGAGFGPCTAIGVEADDGSPLGGVVFNEWRPMFQSLEMSCAADSRRWLTRPIVKQILAYPFRQLNCVRVTAVVARKDKHVRGFIEKLGFRCEGIVRKGLLVDDAAIYGLLRDEWVRGPWSDGQTLAAYPARPRPGLQRADRFQPADGAVAVRPQ